MSKGYLNVRGLCKPPSAGTLRIAASMTPDHGSVWGHGSAQPKVTRCSGFCDR